MVRSLARIGKAPAAFFGSNRARGYYLVIGLPPGYSWAATGNYRSTARSRPDLVRARVRTMEAAAGSMVTERALVEASWRP